jgi:tRNA(fMet)-specific endonuclease VapC
MSTLQFLLDTNILSEPLRAAPDDAVMKRLQRHERALCTASVVWHELLFGAARLPDGKRKITIERYLHDVVSPSLPVLAYDGNAAAWHASERARLAARGLTPPFVDGQIAAVARVHGLVLVTRNVADYRFFEGVAVEDWR